MPRKPPSPKPSVRIFGVDADGVSHPLPFENLVIEVRPGVEMQLSLFPHPLGPVTLFCPPEADMKRRYDDEGHNDFFAVRAGAANVLIIDVETERRTGFRRRAKKAKARRAD